MSNQRRKCLALLVSHPMREARTNQYNKKFQHLFEGMSKCTLEPAVKIAITIGSEYDLVVKSAKVPTAAPSAEPIFTAGLFTD